MASKEEKTADGEGGADGSSSPTASANRGLDDDQRHRDEKLRKYEKAASLKIEQYFLLNDIPRLIRGLEDLAAPEYNIFFIKKLITLAVQWRNQTDATSRFLARAVKEDVLSPIDLEICNEFPENSIESEIVHKACALVSAAHASEAMHSVGAAFWLVVYFYFE
ncbi:MA3 DOMAIN-CONTAINING TRANSLATION REGULATORY FACTOR 4-like [Zingiber officinale]|uniref:MA3 DOMAIN-CONTAINING TRANSLATION REGULATORY FACTOR 4-like n=1 Tax=Zingiber officinale TaxID=94328 RepID=UPI001C4D313E|nr:MA3 DOMAIN-CONTAINING TRANSLATION REGULATORY FACTOR 4-like [Zingiber officinale]